MHDDNTKKVLHATVCAPGAAALRAFCVNHGVTVTAFLDGLGHAVCPHRDDDMSQLEQEMPHVALALRLARNIDASRRSRDQFGQGGSTGGGSDDSTTVSSS
jgi:hypothetical protein